MSKNHSAKTEQRKQARELEQQEQLRKDIKRNRILALVFAVLGILAVVIFVKFRSYIGYYIAALAIPYGAYGLFTPYKSARELAVKGYAVAYSRQLGSLIVSLGVLGIFYSGLYDHLDENKAFMVALLVYMVLFYFAISLINKRYLKKPEDFK